MKKEFLQNLQVAGQPLPPEIIDAILGEHQRDITAATAPYGDYDAIKEQLQTAKDGLKAFEGVDVAQLQGEITRLQGDLAAKDAAHKEALEEMIFDRAVEAAVTAAKGRDGKAIRPFLDLDTLKSSKNREADLKAALEGLKKEKAYLFEEEATPPPYAAGTGSGGVGRQYSQEELARMSMEEYRAYRQGKTNT